MTGAWAGAATAALVGATSALTVEAVQSAFSTVAAQTVGTLLALAVFVATTVIAYRLGPFLRRAMPAETVEAVQAVFVTAVAVVIGAFLTVVWHTADDVSTALLAVGPSPQAGVKLLIVALAFGVAYTATRITKRLIGLGSGRETITTHQREVLHHVVQIVIFLPAILFSLRLFGVPAGSLLLSASALGVVLGLAARQTLGAAIAGFVLLFSRPFEAGDWVEINDDEGIVTEISVFNTQLRTFDNTHVMIPNDQIIDEPITNYSKEDWLRVDVDVGVDYEAGIERAMSIAVDATASCDAVADEPTPDVIVDEFADSAVVLRLLFWIEDPTIQRKWAARNAVMEAVKAAFEREDIKIPFPQRELAGRAEAGGLRIVDGAASDPAADGEKAEHETETHETHDDEAEARETDDGEEAEPEAEGDTGGGSEDRPADEPVAGSDRGDDD